MTGNVHKFASRASLVAFTAALGCITACVEGAVPVEVELRLVGADNHGDRVDRCLPRDPVRTTRRTPSGITLDLWTSRGADLRVGIPADATIEALRIPVLDTGVGGIGAPEVWLAAWVAPELSEPVGTQLAALDWCDVIVDVDGVPRGGAELRPEAARLPAGTFLSLKEMAAAFPQANIVVTESDDEAAKELASFWAKRREDVWRAVACDAELRSRLEREEPAGFASALEELEKWGPVDCSANERGAPNRVR